MIYYKCMIDTRDRSITHNLAKMNFDQIFDFTAGVYFNVVCDLNLLNTFPPPPPFIFIFVFSPALSCSNTPPNIEIRLGNKHFHALDITSLSF